MLSIATEGFGWNLLEGASEGRLSSRIATTSTTVPHRHQQTPTASAPTSLSAAAEAAAPTLSTQRLMGSPHSQPHQHQHQHRQQQEQQQQGLKLHNVVEDFCAKPSGAKMLLGADVSSVARLSALLDRSQSLGDQTVFRHLVLGFEAWGLR